MKKYIIIGWLVMSACNETRDAPIGQWERFVWSKSELCFEAQGGTDSAISLNYDSWWIGGNSLVVNEGRYRLPQCDFADKMQCRDTAMCITSGRNTVCWEDTMVCAFSRAVCIDSVFTVEYGSFRADFPKPWNLEPLKIVGEWFTIVRITPSKVVFTIAPNLTDTSRTLYLTVSAGNCGSYLSVTQSAK
jgi:hypothetical protein